MATPTLDVTFLQYFSPLFVFLLVTVTIYAMLQFTKWMGSNKALHGIIATVIGIIFMFSADAAEVIMFIAPWFTVFFIFIIFLITAYKIFGATDGQIRDVITNWSAGQYTVGVIALIIVLLGLGFAVGQDLLGVTQGEADITSVGDLGSGSTATGSFSQNLGATLFNPKILGMGLILLIATFTIRAMSSPAK